MNNNQNWINRWNENRIGFHKLEYNEYLVKHFDKFTTSSSTVLTPLCGKSLDLLYISKKVKKVIGVELSQKAIDCFIEENNLEFKKKGNLYNINNIDYFLEDFFKLDINTNGRLDIFDRAALVALDKETRAEYAKKIKSVLNGKMLLVSLEYKSPTKKGPPFSVTKEEVYELYGDECDIELLESIDLTISDDKLAALPFAYERIFLISK